MPEDTQHGPVQALVNGRIFTGETLLDDHALLIQGPRILDIRPESGLPGDGVTCLDLEGTTIAPGFIDLQVNGGGGVMFNEAPAMETVARIARAHRRFGTTGLLPTLISSTAETTKQAVTAVASAIDAQVPGVLGIHLEGPHLNPQRAGIHNSATFRPLDADAVDLVSTYCGGKTLVTIAPETTSAKTIRELIERGSIVCAGHTGATYEQTRVALQAGLAGFTHLFNAMSPLTSREPGVVGAALEDAGSYCGIINDGHHVHPASLRIAITAKPRGRVFLVTDAMASACTNADSFDLDGETIRVKNGCCRNAAGTLAGSNLDMIGAVRNTIELLGVELEEALRMASTYPAEFLDLGRELGYLRAGYRANIVQFDEQFRVLQTWIEGETPART